MRVNRHILGIGLTLATLVVGFSAESAMAQSTPPRGASLQVRLKWLEDRAEIDQLISRLSQILDARNIAALPEVATPESVAQMTVGLSRMKRLWLTAQHVMTERWIDINGDRATVKANLIGSNIGRQLPDRPAGDLDAAGRDHFEARGRYVYDLVRTPAGWRLAHTNLDILWTYGAEPSGGK